MAYLENNKRDNKKTAYDVARGLDLAVKDKRSVTGHVEVTA